MFKTLLSLKKLLMKYTAKPVNLLVILLFTLAVLLLAGQYLKQQKVSPQPVVSQVQTPIAQVTITAQGFIPQTILIKKGSTINWTNQDSKPHQVSSDPHPTHTLLPAIGKGKLLPAGSSFTLTFDKTGTFTYHDEQNPLKFKGTVVVK